MKNRRAFTLVELMITIVIMGILGGVAINVFFPSLSATYVSMLENDMSVAAQENLRYYTKHGKYLYGGGKYLRPADNGMVNVGGHNVPMSTAPDGMKYEAKFNRGTCAGSGKPGFTLDYYLNRGGFGKPVLLGKYDSCSYARPKIWQQIYKNGKKVWIER